MISAKVLSTAELKLFRQKMISVYNNNANKRKAEASIVLSMIEGELAERGIEIDDDETFVEEPLLFESIYKARTLYLKIKTNFLLRIS